MSDKFFFKGRQDARQSHIKYGYETKARPIAGSKKHPLTLVVTSEARKHEVALLVADAELFANITVDTNEGAEESIAELNAIMSKTAPVTIEKVPARNEPCPCGSTKKYKKCCG
ncbi:zinc chelation protein SecC [Agarivorans sp. Toyoura001]|uniref:PBPRA1643 family SWIM/SEC-C metal-binding motif protein n=1 Tax=Agarivorans sp. Toyoura001 TaxID=2283141 RepID=UPI0010E0EE51|nr:PBPRA1643 family SWIM/SEC-C metal-binding motif protein [Agarivorans sp. Toyoura001]GDY27493.1 zinc chelation protein SecC [Agarivorans sp. Toyoura001]